MSCAGASRPFSGAGFVRPRDPNASENTPGQERGQAWLKRCLRSWQGATAYLVSELQPNRCTASYCGSTVPMKTSPLPQPALVMMTHVWCNLQLLGLFLRARERGAGKKINGGKKLATLITPKRLVLGSRLDKSEVYRSNLFHTVRQKS